MNLDLTDIPTLDSVERYLQSKAGPSEELTRKTYLACGRHSHCITTMESFLEEVSMHGYQISASRISKITDGLRASVVELSASLLANAGSNSPRHILDVTSLGDEQMYEGHVIRVLVDTSLGIDVSAQELVSFTVKKLGVLLSGYLSAEPIVFHSYIGPGGDPVVEASIYGSRYSRSYLRVVFFRTNFLSYVRAGCSGLSGHLLDMFLMGQDSIGVGNDGNMCVKYGVETPFGTKRQTVGLNYHASVHVARSILPHVVGVWTFMRDNIFGSKLSDCVGALSITSRNVAAGQWHKGVLLSKYGITLMSGGVEYAGVGTPDAAVLDDARTDTLALLDNIVTKYLLLEVVRVSIEHCLTYYDTKDKIEDALADRVIRAIDGRYIAPGPNSLDSLKNARYALRLKNVVSVVYIALKGLYEGGLPTAVNEEEEYVLVKYIADASTASGGRFLQEAISKSPECVSALRKVQDEYRNKRSKASAVESVSPLLETTEQP